VERVLDRGLEERELLLDDEDLLEAARELAEALAVVRVEHPDLHQPDARALELAVVQAEVAQRLQQLVVDLARRDDPDPRVARREADRVELVELRVLARDLQADPEHRALELQRRRREQVAARRVTVRAALPF